MTPRRFNEESSIELCFKRTTAPMMKINGSGAVEYYTTIGDKKKALTERNADDKFFIVWPGQYRSDCFEIQEEDIFLVL